MYLYFIGIFLWLQVINVYAADALIIKAPEIHPPKEFAYLQKPIWKFLKEKLSPYEASPSKKEDIKVLESIFNFDLSGKAQIGIRLKKQSTNEILYEKTSETTFENFWITLESLTKDIKEQLENREVAPPPKDILEEPKKKSQPKENSKRAQVPYYYKQEESSLLSKINPFRKLSQLFSKKEDTLKIKLEVPPPPPPPIGGAYYNEVSKNIKESSPPSVQETEPSSVAERNPSQQNEKRNSPWQWY